MRPGSIVPSYCIRGRSVTGSAGLRVPKKRLLRVPRHAEAAVIKPAKSRLRTDMSLFSSLLDVVEGKLLVLLDSLFTSEVHKSEIMLGLWITSICRSNEIDN